MADREIPTSRQFEAFRYVYFEKLTYAETAERMGITKQAIEGLLRRLLEICPEFKDMLGRQSSMPRKFISYVDTDIYDIEDSF